MFLLAAYKTLFYSHTGETDQVLGADVANRNRLELEPLIGFLVNQLVLRTHFQAEDSFRDLLSSVRATTLEAYSHQDLPFNKIVEALNPNRLSGVNPFYQATFNFQNAPFSPLQLANLNMEPLPDGPRVAQFDLVLTHWLEQDALEGAIEFNTSRFTRAEIDQLTGDYLTTLATVVAQPELKLAEVRAAIRGAAEIRHNEMTQQSKQNRRDKLKRIARKKNT
jgi:non-ribosomal peptide synthetase component F